MSGKTVTKSLPAPSVQNQELQEYAKLVLDEINTKRSKSPLNPNTLASAFGLVTDDEIKSAIKDKYKTWKSLASEPNDSDPTFVQTALEVKEFVKRFLDYLFKLHVKTQKDFTSIHDVKNEVDGFVKKLTTLSYDSKAELKLLLSQQINAFDSARELSNNVTLTDMIQENILKSRGISDEEGRKSFTKFMDVLREFAKYVERNNLTLPRSGAGNDDEFKTRKDKILDGFIQYLYPLEGEQIPKNTPMRKSPEDPLSRQKRIWMDMLRPYFEERILINEEIQKNPLARFEFDKLVRKLQLEKMAEENALKMAALDMSQIVAAIPPDTTKEGSKVIEDMVNGILRKRKIPLKLHSKDDDETTNDKDKQVKGGYNKDRNSVALLGEFVDTFANDLKAKANESSSMPPATLPASDRKDDEGMRALAEYLVRSSKVGVVDHGEELQKQDEHMKALAEYLVRSSKVGVVDHGDQLAKQSEQIQNHDDALKAILEYVVRASQIAVIDHAERLKQLEGNVGNTGDQPTAPITDKIQEEIDKINQRLQTLQSILNVTGNTNPSNAINTLKQDLENLKQKLEFADYSELSTHIKTVVGQIQKTITPDELAGIITDANNAKLRDAIQGLINIEPDMIKDALADLIKNNNDVKMLIDPYHEVTPLALHATLLSGMYAQEQAKEIDDKIDQAKMALDEKKDEIVRDVTNELQKDGGATGINKDVLNKMEALSKGMVYLAAAKGLDSDKKAEFKEVLENFVASMNNNKSVSGGEAQEGGAVIPAGPPPDVPSGAAAKAEANNPLELAKKNLVDLDNAKKEIRAILDTLGGIRTKYNNTFKKLVSPKEVEADQKRFKEIQDSHKDKQEVDVTAEEQQIAAKYQTLQDDGKAWIQDLEKAAAETKERMAKALDMIIKIYATDPTNKRYIDDALEVKMLFEGNYNSTGDDKMGLMSHLGNVVGNIKTEYDNAERVYKPIALSVKERTELQKERIKSKQVINYRGGAGQMVGGEDDDQVTKEIDYIISNLDKLLKTKVQDLDTIFRRATNPVLATAVAEPSLFQILYSQYQDRRNKVGQFVAATELAKTMDANNLIPRKALAVTALDKTVFVFMTLFIRLFSLSLAEWLIQKDIVRKMSWALTAFLGIYITIFLLFAAVVNMDIYRMRLLFNYINFHGNAGLVMTHLGMLVVFSAILFIIIANVNVPIKGFSPSSISEEDKTSLMYRLEVLTMIIWLFLVILVVVL